jgi:hypothetical protein
VACVWTDQQRCEWLCETHVRSEGVPTFPLGEAILPTEHTSAVSADVGPVHEGEWFSSEHAWQCAKWNYAAEFTTEPCTCVHREAKRAREVPDA